VQAFSSVSDFKFTCDEKSNAYVKFMAHEASGDVLISQMKEKLNASQPIPFEVCLKSDDKQQQQEQQEA